jgi:hypothetical protein
MRCEDAHKSRIVSALLAWGLIALRPEGGGNSRRGVDGSGERRFGVLGCWGAGLCFQALAAA